MIVERFFYTIIATYKQPLKNSQIKHKPLLQRILYIN